MTGWAHSTSIRSILVLCCEDDHAAEVAVSIADVRHDPAVVLLYGAWAQDSADREKNIYSPF